MYKVNANIIIINIIIIIIKNLRHFAVVVFDYGNILFLKVVGLYKMNEIYVLYLKYSSVVGAVFYYAQCL